MTSSPKLSFNKKDDPVSICERHGCLTPCVTHVFNLISAQQRSHRNYNLAYIYFKNNEYAQAEKSAREFVSANVSNDKGHKLLGDILLAMNKRQEALDFYEKSLKLNPVQEEVLLHRELLLKFMTCLPNVFLQTVCELITPEPKNIDRLEEWASKAAKSGFTDVVDKFRRCIDAANSSSFPDNKKLNSVLQNMSKVDRSPMTDKSFGLNGLNSSASEAWVHVSPQVQGRDSVDGNCSARMTSMMSTPEKLLLQKQQETLVKNLALHQEKVSKSLEDQQTKLNEISGKIIEAAKGNKSTADSTKKTLDVILKELTDLKVTVKDVRDSQKRTNDAVEKLSQEFQNFQVRFEGLNYEGNEDYEDYEGDEYEDQNQAVITNNQPVQPLQVSLLPTFDHLQIGPSNQPQPVTSSVFSRLGTSPASTTPSTVSSSIIRPPVTGLLSTPTLTTTVTTSTAPAFSFGLASSTSGTNSGNAFGSSGVTFGNSSDFKFGQPTSQTTDKPVEKTLEQPKPTFGFKFGGESSSTVSPFASFASTEQTTGFKWSGSSDQKPAWQSSKAAPIFGQKTNDDEEEGQESGDDEGEDSHDPQFTPIIELPSLVDVTTGEEDEEIVYSHRAKLFRFDAELKQWKERGLGDLKILKHKTKNRFRIVLRREQVHKIACNHYITKEMSLKPMPNSETSLMWSAMDYSDDEPAQVGFAAKFKNVEIMQNFKAKFEECQGEVGNAANDSVNSGKTLENSPPSKPDKDISETKEKPEEEKSSTFGLKFGTSVSSTSSGSNIFSSPNQSAPVFGTSSGKTIFGNTPTPETNGKPESKPSTFGFKFGGESSSTVSPFAAFGSNAATTSETTSGFKWGGSSDDVKPAWQTSKPAPIFGQKASNDADEESGDEEGEEEHDPQFTPIIELPSLVDVTTGEEDEEIVYSHRAKLFRFDAELKQWKERGLGDLKILKHKTKNRFRIVLRREQVHKIACNHYITKEMSLKPMPNSETSLMWSAMDYSDDEPAQVGFAAKFKNVEIMQTFKAKFEECQSRLN